MLLRAYGYADALDGKVDSFDKKHRLNDLSVAISAYGRVAPPDEDSKNDLADNGDLTERDSLATEQDEAVPGIPSGTVATSARLSNLQYQWSSNPEFPEKSTLGHMT